MQYRGTFTLLLLAAVVVALVIFIERPLRLEKNKVPSKELFNLQPEDIQSVRLRINTQPEIMLTKEGKGWQLTKPNVYPADDQLVEAFVSKLLGLEWQARILPGELAGTNNSAAQFGLETPQASIMLGNTNRTLQILVGSPTAFGDQCFVKVVGQGAIYVVDAELFRSFPGAAAAWRERRLLASIPEHDAVRIRIADTTFELQQNPTNSQWRFTRPFEGRVNWFALTNATATLTQHTVVHFVDVPETRLAQLGFNPEKPAGEITLLQGTNELFQIAFGGSPTNSPTNVFARITGRSGVVLLLQSVIEPWASPKASLRDYHLMSLDPEAVTSATFETTNSFRVQKNGTNWVITNSNIKLDSLLVSQIIYHLRNTAAEEERAVVTDLSAYGLDKSAMEVTLTTKNQGNVVLSFAPSTTNKVYVHHSGETALYSIEARQFARLPHAAWQLRDRRIWDFKPAEVQRILLEQDSRKGSFIRNAKSGWSLGPGTQGILNTFWLEETLARLGKLTAVFWRDQGTANFKEYGLEPPAHKLALQFGEGKPELEMWFGNASEYGHRFAATRIDGEWHVFEIPSSIYEEYIVPNLTIERLFKKF